MSKSKYTRCPPELKTNKSTLHKKYELTDYEKQKLLKHQEKTNVESESIPKLKFTKRVNLAENQDCYKKMLADLPNRLNDDHKKIYGSKDLKSELHSIDQSKNIENDTFVALKMPENDSTEQGEGKEQFRQNREQETKGKSFSTTKEEHIDQMKEDIQKKTNNNRRQDRYFFKSSTGSSNIHRTKNNQRTGTNHQEHLRVYETSKTKSNHQNVTFDRGLSTPDLILKSQQLMKIQEAEEERELKKKKQSKQNSGLKSEKNNGMRNELGSKIQEDQHLKYIKLAFYKMDES